ncbi:MAG: DNA alkylation repair protein [Flammeovirgaceae bacterium]|nr:DNA alkylation repair protein [Flammeovirgaceae bacterium]
MLHPFLKKLQVSFENHTNTEKAVFQKKYLQNQFEFYGLTSPERKLIVKNHLSSEGLPPINSMEDIIRNAYQQSHREYHYFAIEFMEKYQKQLLPVHLELCEYLITTHSWWDTVDIIATHLVSGLVKKYPVISLEMDKWIENENMWIVRTAILHQLKFKQLIDGDRLFSYCKKQSGSNEFFIKKAIGWVLREYSKTNPEAVIQFINSHKLKPLSVREGLKWVNRK